MQGDSQAGAHLFCSTCNIHCSSPEVMQQHYKGQKHQMAEKWHRTITGIFHVTSYSQVCVAKLF